MKNCVKKKMTKKTERRWNRWFVGAFVFAKAIFRRNIISIRSFERKETNLVAWVTLAKHTKGGKREERRKHGTKQGRAGWLICL